MGACSTVGGQQQKTLTEHTFSCYSLVLQDVNNPLMTVFMSQEKSNTIIMQNVGGQTRCIMGFAKTENAAFSFHV